MKELILNKEGLMLRQNSASTRELTTQARERYSKGGDNFMATEGQSDMPPNSQPTNPEHAGEVPQASGLGVEKPVSVERQATAREAWEEADRGKTLTFEEGYVRKQMIERGLGPVVGGAGGDTVEKTGIPAIDAEIEVMNNTLDTKLKSPLGIYLEAIGNISRLTDVDETRKQATINAIQMAIKDARAESEKNRPAEEQERRYSLYFTPAEQDALREDPTRWLDTQFDILYRFAEEGQELSSPIINGVQQQVSQAVDFVKNYRPEVMSDFLIQYTVRLHLLQMRTTIGYRSIENVKQAAHELRFHGLLTGMTLERGMVGAMFNRFQDLLESTRLSSNSRHHVMLEDAYKLQRVLIDEQMGFAKKGIGNFGDLSDITVKDAKDQDLNNSDTWDDFTWAAKMTDKQIKENEKMSEEQKERIIRIKNVNARITRSVRTAYDVFVSSQRMGVVVARGKYLLKDSSRYRSDPIGPLNVYNMEELLFEKFEMYSPEQEEMVDRMKLDIAEAYLKDQKKTQGKQEQLTREQKLDLGKRLFRDIFAVPDFFSSGWRIEGVIQALKERFGEETAGDFALFMRLKIAKEKKDPNSKAECREDVWNKIREFRPEEIIRLFRERKNNQLTKLYEEMIAIDSGDSGLNITDEDKLANRPDEDGGRVRRDITVYDKFKKKYGAVIGLLRQEGFNRKDGKGNQFPTQIDLSKLDKEQTETVNKFLEDAEGAEKLKKLVTAMQGFINESRIKDLSTSNKFADIYTRSIIVDDALLDKLEDEVPETNGTSGNLGYSPLSKIIGEAGAGGDTLVRSWTDTENAAKAGNALLKFIKEEDLEKKTNAALEFAGSASMYNGLGAKGQAEGVRHTIGTYLNLSKLDMAWDIVGINSLPLRIPASDAQRIFGVQDKAMSRDELRESLDHLRGFLTSSVTKARETLKERKKEIAEKGLSDKDKREVRKNLPKDYKEKAKGMNLSEDEFLINKFIESLETKLKKDEEDSQKFYKNMEDLLEVTGKDFWKRTGFRLLLYLMLAAIGETYMAGKASASK
ncbi:MAG: hypothetical protein AAB662_00810 [Patescibacteria group bacterium]